MYLLLRENKCSKDNLSINIVQYKRLSMPMADSKISNHSRKESVSELENH